MIHITREEYDLLILYTFDIERQYAHYYNHYSLDYSKDQIRDLCIDRFVKEVNQRRESQNKELLGSADTDEIILFITRQLQAKNDFIIQQDNKIQQEVLDFTSQRAEIPKLEQVDKEQKKKIDIPLPEPYSDDFNYVGEQYDALKKLQPI